MSTPPHRAIPLAIVGAAVIFFSACAVNYRAPVESGTIPSSYIPTAQAQQFGQRLFKDLQKDYAIDSSSDHHDQLTRVFHDLAGSANVDPHAWRLYLFQDPELVDVRAVHGNFMFVWSGLFDVVESDDELAGLLACELAHALARHTEPVQFSVASELLFGVVDVVTMLGVTMLSQGLVSVSTPGLTKWAYTEAADLDPLDRVYTVEEVQEMAAIALLILTNSEYSPDALVGFWRRVQDSERLKSKIRPLIRRMSPQERIALLESVMGDLPAWEKRVTEHRTEDQDREALDNVPQPDALLN